MNAPNELYNQNNNVIISENQTSSVDPILSDGSEFREETTNIEVSYVDQEESPAENHTPAEVSNPSDVSTPSEDVPPAEEASSVGKASGNNKGQINPETPVVGEDNVFPEIVRPQNEPPKALTVAGLKVDTKIKTEIFDYADIKARVDEFQELDTTVRSFGKDSLKAGMALARIAEQKLWSLQFRSWPAYRAHLIGFDVVHISRLVFAAEFVKLVEKANEVNPEKVMIVPESEYQIRAISRKLTDEQKLEVWRQACARSENQPTNQVVNEVRVLLFPTTKESKPPTKKHLIVKALKDVETLLDAQAPFEDIKSSLHHLSRILKVDIDEDEESSEPAEAC